MRIRPLLPLAALFVGTVLGLAANGGTEWTDADGARFAGEPADVLGSLALFRTGDGQLRPVPLRALPTEECRSLFQGLAARPPRAERWDAAQGRVTRELLGRALRLEYQYRKFIPADLAARPEPQVLVVLYGSSGESESWAMANNFLPAHNRIQTVYPGLVATVFYGIRQGSDEVSMITRESWASWLVADPARLKEMPLLGSLAPSDGPRIVALTRNGEILLSARPRTLADSRDFVDRLAGLLWNTHPANTRAWGGLAHYGKAVRPVEFAEGVTGPRLIGNPLKPEGLRQRGVGRIVARIEVDPEGKATDVTFLPGSSVTEKLSAPLADALRQRTVFLPAIDHGRPVAGGYDFVMDVPPPNPSAEADAAWLDGTILGEVPLREWKILKPIPVNQREFSDIQGVGPDGKVIMHSLEVSKAKVSRASQMSAFNSDWFGEAGAVGIQPVDGQTQVVDGLSLTWRTVESDNGFVDLQAGEIPPRDYCVGYAWTEIEVSADTPAWLGIGSDDGLKVWHNGTLVNDRWAPRYSQLDADIVPLKLRQGKNHLLIKVQNVLGNWSFVARLRYRDR